jgi:L-fuculose-phosphate aldolase
MPEEDDLRQQICDAGKRLYDRFFIAANDGNISCRLNEGEILITPTGTNKADIQPDQILKVDFKGNVLTGYMKPTSEMKMHLMVYDKRQDIQAIVHAHPPTATGFAASGVRLDQDVLLPEVIFGLGRIGFAGYATPTTQEVPEAVAQEIADCDAMLLSNHGALTVGDTVLQAYYRMETLEMYCKIRLVSNTLGSPKTLSESQIQDLYRVREQRGWGKGLPGAGETSLDQKTIDLIAQVVLEVLKEKGLAP